MTTSRVVLDTSVLVSGLLGGSSVSVLERWRQGDFTLIISPDIYAEYETVLKRPKFKLPASLVNEMLTFIREKSHWVEPKIQINIVRDSTDNKFIEAALDGKASVIISSDRDLLDLKHVKDISIVPPWEFTS